MKLAQLCHHVQFSRGRISDGGVLLLFVRVWTWSCSGLSIAWKTKNVASCPSVSVTLLIQESAGSCAASCVGECSMYAWVGAF